VLKRHGIEPNPEYELVANFDSNTAEIAMDEFLTRKKLPTAIFCESDEMAFGVYKSLQKKGLRIPEDFSIVGFDDHGTGVANHGNGTSYGSVATHIEVLGDAHTTVDHQCTRGT
jgi:DNA-binding LacI/PurR family transcriptional regulator